MEEIKDMEWRKYKTVIAWGDRALDSRG